MMKTLCLRIEDEMMTSLQKITSKKQQSEAIRLAISAYVQIYKHTTRDLSVIFDEVEMAGIVDSLNGTMLVAQYQASREIFQAHCSDSEHFESSFSKHGANIDKVLRKIESLTAAEVFILQQLISDFRASGEELKPFLEQYAKAV